MKTDPKAASRFLAELFKHSDMPVFICSLANDRAATGRLPPRQVVTRNRKLVEHFVEHWDRAERALYFCVATLKLGALRRAKVNLGEIVCLHADLDFKGIEASPKEIERKLARFAAPPSIVVNSGNGLHLYWRLRDPLLATTDNVARIEAALRRVAYLLAADPAVCECARLLRLPGSHNSKNGGWLDVRVLQTRRGSYRLHKLETTLARAPQLLQRRARADAPGTHEPVNFFTGLGEAQAFTPPIDVEERLAAMEFHGSDETSIHNTQLSVTAALLRRGWGVEAVVERVFKATEAAAGRDGRSWDWHREERDLRLMCASWLTKHPVEVFEA
jgi:RepB DNA-primase from phage plasmid